MVNLFRMDTYRIFRCKTFFVCLIVAFALALGSAPFEKLLFSLGRMFVTDATATVQASDEFTSEDAQEMEKIKNSMEFNTKARLSDIISNPFTFLSSMLMLLSVCFYFYSDVENGYIKNIAGQMPQKGFTILSKFLAAGVHNMIFMLACVIGNIAGTLTVRHFVPDSAVVSSIGVFFLKFLLMQSICALILLFVSTFRNKSLGTVTAVMMGLGFIMPIIYGLIDNQLINRLFKDAGEVFSKYMPDVLMGQNAPDALTSVLVSVAFGGFFLLLAIRIFDRKDVK